MGSKTQQQSTGEDGCLELLSSGTFLGCLFRAVQTGEQQALAVRLNSHRCG